MPDPVIVVRAYLLDQPVVTDITGDRISTDFPEVPSWPRVRISAINVRQRFPKRFDRALMQFDCYAEIDPDAARLAQSVRAALAAVASWVGPDAVLTGTTDVVIVSLPDDAFTPAMPRWAVSAYVYLRSNP